GRRGGADFRKSGHVGDHIAVLLSQSGLRYSAAAIDPARRPSAGAVPGRCGACSAVRTPPATTLLSILKLALRKEHLPRLLSRDAPGLCFLAAPRLPPDIALVLYSWGRSFPSTTPPGHIAFG